MSIVRNMPLSIDTARCRERPVVVVERETGGEENRKALCEGKDEERRNRNSAWVKGELEGTSL